VTAPIGPEPTDPLSLAALDVTLQAAGLDTVIAAFTAVDEAGEKTAATAGVIPMSAPGSAETIAAIQTAAALLNELGITAKTTAAGGMQTLVVAERDLANAQGILAAAELDVTAVSQAQAKALAEQAAAAREAAVAARELGASRAGGGGGSIVLPPGGGGVGGAGGAAEEDAAIVETTGLYAGLGAQLLELIAVYETYRAIRDAVAAGGQFDASIESARLGIAAITQAYGTLTDAQGQVLTGQDALTAAFGIADAELQALQADAVRVAIPFQTLADLFRGIEGAGLHAGATLDQIRQLVTSASLAATALGTPYEQLNTTLVQLLEGHVRITNQLVAHLGLSSQIVHEWQQQGTLIPNLLATFEKFNGIGEQVQGTWRGISTEIKNAFDIITGTAIRPALTTLEEGLRGILGDVIDTTTGKVNAAFSGLVQYVGAGLDLIAKGIVEGFTAAVNLAKDLSGWLDRNRTTMQNLVGGALALVEGIGAVVKEAIGIVAPVEAAYITSGLVLVPIKAVGYALALAVDAVHALGAAFSGAGFLFMNLILTPLDLFNETLGKALNFIHAGLGDGLIAAGKDGEAALQRIAGPALAFIQQIETGNTAVQQFGKNWQAAQQDATSAAAAIQKAIADATTAVANFKFTPPPTGGDGKDAVANAQAAAQIIAAAVDAEKAKLKAALDQGQLSYKAYFDALTTIEIASLDAQIRAKQAALAAAAKPDQRTKIEGEIAKLEEQEQAVRLKNLDELATKQQANADKLLADDERVKKAEGDTYAAELAAIGKLVEAHDRELALAGATDAVRRQSNQAMLSALTQQLDIQDDRQRVEVGLAALAHERATLESEVRVGLVPEQQAEERMAALEAARLPVLKQLAEQGLALAQALGNPTLIAQMQALLEKMEQVTNQSAALGRLKQDWDRTMAEVLASGTATATAVVAKMKEMVERFGLTQPILDYFTRLAQAANSVTDQFETFGQNIGQAIIDGLVKGVGTKGGTVLGNVGKAILAGIGGVFEQVGEALISYGVIMTALLPALENIFTSGPAAIVAGAALAALGAAMQAAFQGGGSSGGGRAPGFGGPQTINIALPGGVGQGGAPIPGAQPPAVPPGARPVPIPPSGSLTVANAIPAPTPTLPPASAQLGTAGPPINIQVVTLGRWSPTMQAEAMREIRLAMRRGL